MTKNKKVIHHKTAEQLHDYYTKPFKDGYGWNEKRVNIYLELEKGRILTDIVNSSNREFGLSNVGFMKRAREEGVVLPEKYRNGWVPDPEVASSPEGESAGPLEETIIPTLGPLEPIVDSTIKKFSTIPELKLPDAKQDDFRDKQPEAKAQVPPKKELNPKVVEQINEIKEPAEAKPLLPPKKGWRGEDDGLVCPKCGKPIEEAANFCGGCGQKFGEEEKKDSKIYSPANLFTQAYKVEITSGVQIWYHYCCLRFGYKGTISEWLNDCVEDCVKARGWSLAIIESPEAYDQIAKLLGRGNNGSK